MHEYILTFARSARRELERLDTTVIARVLPRIEALVDEPRPSGCRKLRGSKNLWRIRIGDYRVIYEV
ncbi:MAG: type II toxin-antitoxin system RelE/ParE family toxin, partial [Rhodothermales bacterium]